ncbi:MAG: hypothetical protein MK193_10950 [Lentisphaeria bacterium]|nr:hypothetical protein [Lentisphaeria bacterium]
MQSNHGYFTLGDHVAYVVQFIFADAKENLLFVNPFGEERKNILGAYRSFVDFLDGQFNIFIIDLPGIGEAQRTPCTSVEQWQKYLQQFIEQVESSSDFPINLLGTRLSANILLNKTLLSLPYVKSSILWAPYESGSKILDEWIRRKQVKEMMSAGGAVSSLETFEETWAAGNNVDLDGFELTPTLGKSIQSLEATLVVDTSETQCHIMLCQAGARIPSFVETLFNQNKNFEYSIVKQKPFWGMTDYVYPKILFEKTHTLLLK